MDSGHHWLANLCPVIGMSHDGAHYDEGAVVMADHDPGDHVRATVSDTAADLDCGSVTGHPWFRSTGWGATVLAAMDAVLAENID